MYQPGFGGGYDATIPVFPLKRVNERQIRTLLKLDSDSRARYASGMPYAKALLDAITSTIGNAVDLAGCLSAATQVINAPERQTAGVPESAERTDILAQRLKHFIDQAKVPDAILPQVLEELMALAADRNVLQGGLESASSV